MEFRNREGIRELLKESECKGELNYKTKWKNYV